MHLVFFLVLVVWICDDRLIVTMMMMTVDLEVSAGKGISKVAVVREGEGIVLQSPEEVVMACLLEFSCVPLGWVVLEIFLFPANARRPVVLLFRGLS